MSVKGSLARMAAARAARKMAEVPLGTPADVARRRWRYRAKIRSLGEDPDPRGVMAGKPGYIFEWEFPWGVLVFKRRRWGENSAHCYRVVEKKAKDDS